mmetsp:Transcript_103579/g.144282  ORF Transcript_103579/g.144282 Transcript_103579/m.144282 type:complete len:455 (-) Transcript_103579:78-1442(-)
MKSAVVALTLATLVTPAAADDHCNFPVHHKEKLCEPTAEVLGDLDPSTHCVLYSVMNNNKSCSTVCREKKAKCVDAVDDVRTRRPCEYNKEVHVDCETANYYDLHCICEVEKEEEPEPQCDYLHPLTGKAEKECTEGTFTTQLKDGGKNCVALARLHKRSTCKQFCESKGATCVDAVDNTIIGKGCEGFYDKVEAVDCDSTGFQDLHCVCTKDEPTTTTTTTSPGCDALLPFVNPGEKFCTEGEIVEKLEDGGANCVVYAVLAKKTTCNDFCEARNTVCVNAIDNVKIGTGCEYDLEEKVSCASKHFFDMQCVCRKPTRQGCSSVALCDEVCNITYAEDRHQARCLQHCASNADKFLNFVKGSYGMVEGKCEEMDGAALLQRKVESGVGVVTRHASHLSPPPCEYNKFCKGLCGAVGYLHACEEKCMAAAHAVKFLLTEYYDTCIGPLQDDVQS